MASKVLVKIPVNFGSQVGKCSTADIISASVSSSRAPVVVENAASSMASNHPDSVISVSCDPVLYITQLEQNIKFLKEQHHLMLTSLHHEVETLRQRNRDLQFQLVFSKGSLALLKSTPSSPEDDSKPQVALSPKQVNVTTLQVEILERDIVELRSSLNEAKVRNTSLENVIDEQKKQLESTKKTSSDDSTPSGSAADPDMVFKLEEAEKIIRRLRRENDEQRREIAMIKANQSREQICGNSAPHQRAQNHRGQQQHHDQPREYHHDQHREHRDQRSDSHYEQTDRQQEAPREGSRFPPLNNQKFWHNNGGTQRGRWNHSWDSGRGAGGSRMLNQSLPSLPGLPMGSNAPNNTNPSSAPFALLSHGGGRRIHRGSFRGDRSGHGSHSQGGGRGGNSSGQQGSRGHWDQNREHRGRNRDQQGYND